MFDNKRVSEWLEFGTFYIHKREDAYMGLVKLTCYDAMLKTEQAFVADDNYNDLGWPKSMKDVVELIADRIGVGIDPRTRIKTGADYVVPLPKDLTVRQVLGYIATCHGGNWIITEENMLRLVPLTQAPNETFNIISADYEDIIVPPGDNLVWQHPTDPLIADLTTDAVANTYNMTFNGIQFAKDGWTGKSLDIGVGASVDIDYRPFATDITATVGKTIELNLKVKNVYDYSSVVFIITKFSESECKIT